MYKILNDVITASIIRFLPDRTRHYRLTLVDLHFVSRSQKYVSEPEPIAAARGCEMSPDTESFHSD